MIRAITVTVVVALLASPHVAAAEGRPSEGCGKPPPVRPGVTGRLELPFDQLDREYRLRLPRSYREGVPMPLVLDFHGYTGSAASKEEYSGLSEHAEHHGYVVVYPQSTAFVTPEGDRVTSWNDLAGSAGPGPAGEICSGTAFEYPHPPECGEPVRCNWATCHDDIGFVSALLDRLEATLCVDLDRVYATGMSNGGMFVHRLGCDLPQRFAAIAPVGGTLARGFNCAPSTALAMMNVWGREDHYVSQERVESTDGYYYTSATDVLERWADRTAQDCDQTATPFATAQDGKLGLECSQHAACASGAEVVHCSWDGAHDWPPDGVANDLIWEFFSRHSRNRYSSK